MGALANGFGYGTATGAANSSLNFAQTGTALSAGGQVLSGVGGYQQAAFQAQIARNNAAILGQNAEAASRAGAYEESASKLRTGQTVGAEKAAQGANGVDLNIGSPAAVRGSTQTLGAMDAAMIHYNAAKEAFNYRTEAANDLAQSALDKRAGLGALAGGFLGAGASLLSGGSSVASKWAQYRLSGAET